MDPKSGRKQYSIRTKQQSVPESVTGRAGRTEGRDEAVQRRAQTEREASRRRVGAETVVSIRDFSFLCPAKIILPLREGRDVRETRARQQDARTHTPL